MTTILAAILGAVLYRLRGWNPAPEGVTLWWKRRPILQIAFAAPYAITTYFALGPLASFFVMMLTTGAVITGHASYSDLGTSAKLPADGQTDEWFGT